MEKQPVIDKIRKLLALANSSNEHEAALAAAHAQRLLAAHNLAMADIMAASRPEKADRIEAVASKSLPKWLRQLVAGVSSAFDCQAIHHPASGKLTFVGVGADVQIAVYTFSYLQGAVRRICGNYMKQQATAAKRQRELLRQSYYLGAVAAINQRLLQQKKETPLTPGALVPVKDGLIRAALQEIGALRTIHARASHVSSDAYSKGKTDAMAVGMHQGIADSARLRKLIAAES